MKYLEKNKVNLSLTVRYSQPAVHFLNFKINSRVESTLNQTTLVSIG